MITLGLNSDHDLMFYENSDGSKDLALFVGAEAVSLHVKTRILHHFGEWFINRNSGVPWKQTIMANGQKAKYNQTIAESIIKKTVLDTPGVESFVGTPVFTWDFSNSLAGRSLKILSMCILVDCQNSRESIKVELN